MSFSSEVKEELTRVIGNPRHCQIAELTAILSVCGRIQISEYQTYKILVCTENSGVAKKYYSLLKNIFQMNASLLITKNTYLKKNNTYRVKIDQHDQALQILRATKLIDSDGEIQEDFPLTAYLLQKECCKRAFLRGIFLTSGSMSDPEKNYHFEIVCSNKKRAEFLKEMLLDFQIDAKIILRKKNYILYIKEGAMIVDILNVMEAHIALMKLENVRILKDMRNSVNRRVNCETANINKTVLAATKQLEDIVYLKEKIGLDQLPKGLGEIAKVRLEHPEATLKELGTLLEPPVGKSGVNHRLRKLCDMAEELRVSQLRQ